MPDPDPDPDLQGADYLAASRGAPTQRSLTHGDGRLPGARLAGNQDRPPSDLPFADHLQHHARRPPGRQLPYHALGSLRMGGDSAPGDFRGQFCPCPPLDMKAVLAGTSGEKAKKRKALSTSIF